MLLGEDDLLDHFSMWTKLESIWASLLMQSCSNLEKGRNGFERVSWGYTILHDMRLGQIIKYVICDMLEFSWNFWRILPLYIFQKLEISRKGF